MPTILAREFLAQKIWRGGGPEDLQKQGRKILEKKLRWKISWEIPRGPKDQKNSRFQSGLKISSENEIFERATHRGPIFCGEIETSRLTFSSEIKKFDRDQKFRARFIDLLMGLFRGAVFHHGGGDRKQPIKQPTENSDQHHGLNGPFPLVNGPFSDLNGAFHRFPPKGPFCPLKIH